MARAAGQQLLTGKTRLPGLGGEWATRRLGELFQFLNTANNARADLTSDGDIVYIHYGDVHTHTDIFLDLSSVRLPNIPAHMVANLPGVRDGDLIMADASEDYEGVGKSVEVCNLRGRRAVAGLHTFLLRGDDSQLARGFRGYLQHIVHVKRELERVATGTSVYGIAKSNVKDVTVLLPPLPEQQAIAAVLADLDADVRAVEAERDKAISLKRGMMQELLTGRTRLV